MDAILDLAILLLMAVMVELLLALLVAKVLKWRLKVYHSPIKAPRRRKPHENDGPG